MLVWRGVLWWTLILTSFISKAELETNHTGVLFQTGFQVPEITVIHPEAIVDAHIGKASWKARSSGIGCTSVMGPTCFYTAPQAPPVAPESRVSDCSGRSRDHAERDYLEGALQQSGGIMAQYLQASQSQLGAVHGHSDTISEHWQRIGAAREGRLDDVVHVKVGRGGSVQSVYERSKSLKTPSEAGALLLDHEEREHIEEPPGTDIGSGVCQGQSEEELEVKAGGAESA